MDIRNALFAATILLLTGAVAQAGIIFLPVGGRVVQFGEVELSISKNMDIASSLVSRLDCPGAPPDDSYVEADQTLELAIDRRTGEVTGTATGTLRSFDMASPLLAIRSRVSGTATCVDGGGRSCAHLVLELRSEGVLSTQGQPERVGLLRQDLLGSLTLGGGSAQWQAIDFTATLGGSEEFLQGLLGEIPAGYESRF